MHVSMLRAKGTAMGREGNEKTEEEAAMKTHRFSKRVFDKRLKSSLSLSFAVDECRTNRMSEMCAEEC